MDSSESDKVQDIEGSIWGVLASGLGDNIEYKKGEII